MFRFQFGFSTTLYLIESITALCSEVDHGEVNTVFNNSSNAHSKLNTYITIAAQDL